MTPGAEALGKSAGGKIDRPAESQSVSNNECECVLSVCV